MRQAMSMKTVGIKARVGAAFVVLVAGLAFTSAAAAQETVAGEFERLLEVVEGDHHLAEQLAAAHQLADLRVYMGQSEYIAGLKEAAEAVDEPLVEFVLQRRAARAKLESLGGDEGIDDARFADEQSCLVDWELVGPFSNSSMQGFHETLGPELGEEGPFSGRLAEVGWRPLDSGHHLCAYQLNSRVEPSTSAVAYLGTTVEVETAQSAQLLVGSESAYRIWVNGQPVGQRKAEHGLGIDAEGWDVRLDPGENEILVKLGSGGQGGLAWMARLVDDEGEVLEDWEASGGVNPRQVESFEPQGEPDGGVRAVLQEGIDSGEPSAKLAGALLWKRLYPDDSGTPWRDVGEQLEEKTDELSARELVGLATLYEELWRRQAVLDEAAENHDDPLVELERARQRGDSLAKLEQNRQRRELEALVDEYPGFLKAQLALVRWYREHEGAGSALAALRTMEDDYDQVPVWVRTAAQLHEDAGDAERAFQLREEAAKLHRLSGTFGRQLLRELLAAGDTDGGAGKIEEYQRRAPWSQNWKVRELMLHQAYGDIEEALAVVDALVAESPGDASLRKRRAELLLVNGDRQGAMEAVEEAIALRPQATRYQRYLEYLQPESSRFFDAWEITGLRELAEEAEESSRSFDRLVDQTVQQVASNGLSSEYNQRAHRVLDDRGVSGARRMRVTYRPGDERVEVLGVRVYKEDGTISEDYDEWETSRTRQGARKYNDRGYVNLRANNVDEGDIVEFRYVVHEVANENFRGDYFGDVSYVESVRPIVKGRYAVLYPEDWQLHFRAPEIEHRAWEGELPDGQQVDGQNVTAFEYRDVSRVRTEDDQPGNTDVYDYILVSNKETYDDVARWWWELIEEQLVVDDAIRSTVREVTEGLETDADKLEAIYEYVVRNTRYLHVGLGIHGWKPYRTSTVYRNRYGDCKDKAALLKVMLDEAGIDTEMVLVRTRRLGSVDDEPASMNIFNHAVAYVPSKDLFLDPTARFNGPYELTQMDQGAQALVVRDGGGGEWVTMPVDDAEDNLVRRHISVDYNAGTPVIEGEVESHGARAVRDRRGLEDPERRDEDFEDRLRSRFSGLSLIEAAYDNLDSLTEPSKISYTAEAPGAIRGSESRLIYPIAEPLNLLNRHARQSTRQQDLTFRVPFARQTTVEHQLPEGKTVASLPEPTQLDSPFGYLEMSYDYDEGQLVVQLDYAIEVQRVQKDDYPEFRRFVAEMDEAVNETIRLVESDEEV